MKKILILVVLVVGGMWLYNKFGPSAKAAAQHAQATFQTARAKYG